MDESAVTFAVAGLDEKDDLALDDLAVAVLRVHPDRDRRRLVIGEVVEVAGGHQFARRVPRPATMIAPPSTKARVPPMTP